MKREVITTADGSNTIHIPFHNESYHSMHGALQEAEHVFIRHGLELLNKANSRVKIFEMGFGTGLNAILAHRWALKHGIQFDYTGIEAFPVEPELLAAVNYESFLNQLEIELFKFFHESNWNESLKVGETLRFKKIHDRIENYQEKSDDSDIVFYDAFGPGVNPELWQPTVLTKMYNLLKNDGILVTYCAQGQFKRNLKAIGFKIEVYPGPPGKREMTVAIKQ